MTIQKLIAQHPDVYIQALNHGAWYAMYGYTNFSTIKDMELADRAINEIETEMQAMCQDIDSRDEE